MGFNKRDVLAIVGILAAAPLTVFTITTGLKSTSEALRFLRVDISAPLGELTAMGTYWNIYSDLLLAQQGYGEAMFKNLPCNWGPLAGYGTLPVNPNPEVPLYLIPTEFLQYFGYASQYATLSSMGLASKMLCLEQTNGTWCDCNLEVSYPNPAEFVHKGIYQGNVFKFNERTIFRSVWIDSDDYVVDSEGNYKDPKCKTSKNKRASLSKSYTIHFIDHYMEIHVCTGTDYDPPDRFFFQLKAFITCAVFLGVVSISLAMILLIQPKICGKIIPKDTGGAQSAYETVSVSSPGGKQDLSSPSSSN